eukprot:g2403.t1
MGCCQAKNQKTPALRFGDKSFRDLTMKRDSRSRSRALTKSAEKERLRRLSIGKEITVKHYRVDQRTFSSVYKGSPKSPKTRLGKGAQGTVFLATNRYTGLQVAVKTLDKIFLEESEIKILMKEIQLLACADHPSIIRILESYEDMHYIYLVMELCEGGKPARVYRRIVGPNEQTECTPEE